MPAHYMPVSSIKGEAWDKAMHWHDPPQYFFYPYMLISPFVSGYKPRSSYGGKELTIYADSGGFQIMTQGKKVSSYDVLEWQKSVADVGFTLDSPPSSYDSNHPNNHSYPKHYFERCLKNSVQWANEQYANLGDTKMKLWAVVHGKNMEEIKQWYEAQTKEHTFDGYSVAVTGATRASGDPFNWLKVIPFAHMIKEPIHWLGRCEPIMVLILAKLSYEKHIDYSYDTSSNVAGPRWGKYYDPFFLNLIALSKYEDKRVKVNALPCDCPVCLKHTLEEVINTDYLILLHNVYRLKRFNEYANAIVSDDDLFDYAVDKLLGSTSKITSKRIPLVKDTINSIVYGTTSASRSLTEYF